MLTPSNHSKPLTIDQSRSRLHGRPTSGPGGVSIEQGIVVRWAKKLWLRGQGGYLITTLRIAVLFGALTGSTVLPLWLVAFALVGTVYARSRP